MPRIFPCLSAILLTALLSACACAPTKETKTTNSVRDNAVSVAELPRVDAEHLTLRGDVLRVTIYGEEDLSGDYTVGRDGKIALKLVGPVSVGGEPLSALPAIIGDAYKQGYLVDPKVSVEVH